MPSEAKKIPKSKLKLDRSVVLVGLMGAGKTTVGRRLATVLGVPFVDSDQEIVDAAGCCVSDIFEIYGEKKFRDLEQRVIHRLLEGKPQILATGGGAFISPEVRKEIKAKGLSIWLKADIDVLVERVSRRDNRPLLKRGDKREILERLMEERYPIYQEADITVASDMGAHEKVVTATLHALEEWVQTHG